MKDASGAATPKPLVNERRNVPHLKLVASPETAAPLWTAPSEEAGPPTTSQVLHTPLGMVPQAIEAKMVAVLSRDRRSDENYATSGANREQELREVLADLGVTEAYHLRRRLEAGRVDDPLCVAFQRFVIERRQRLLVFLGDARRRLAAARRG